MGQFRLFDGGSDRRGNHKDPRGRGDRRAQRARYRKTEAHKRNLERKLSDLKTRLRAIRALGCERCDEKDPVCIHFHHRDGSQKEIELARCKTWGQAERELRKCDRICANCHMKLHAAERIK